VSPAARPAALSAPGAGPAHRLAVRKERPAPATRSVQRRDMTGKTLGEVQLAPEIFGIEPNQAVLHQVVTAQLAAARAGTQSTKTRAEVRGGGSKPWRQKGTGRARQGSSRSPIWTGGGVALGPKPRSYVQRTPKKMVRLALCSALSDRAAESKVALVDCWDFEAPKTKDAIRALEALGLGDEELTAERSFTNIPHVQTALSAELCAYDVLRNDWVVFTDGTLPGGQPAARATQPTDDAPPAAETKPTDQASSTDEDASAEDTEDTHDTDVEAER
jgi:large subunit ribosomal protein L4